MTTNTIDETVTRELREGVSVEVTTPLLTVYFSALAAITTCIAIGETEKPSSTHDVQVDRIAYKVEVFQQRLEASGPNADTMVDFYHDGSLDKLTDRPGFFTQVLDPVGLPDQKHVALYGRIFEQLQQIPLFSQ